MPMASRRLDITSDLDALLPDPALHLALNSREMFSRLRLEAHHDHGLGVGRADQSPPVGILHSHPVHGDYFVAGTEVFRRLFYNSEFDVVRTFDADLRRRYETRHIG